MKLLDRFFKWLLPERPLPPPAQDSRNKLAEWWRIQARAKRGW